MKLFLHYTLFLSPLFFFSPIVFASSGYPGISLVTAHTFTVLERGDEFYNSRTSNISASAGNAKINYAFDLGLFIGVTHSYGTGTTDQRRQFGPNIGFSYEGFSAGLSYMIDPEYKINDIDITYTDGEVFLFEVSYHFKFAKYFVLGANLTYHSETYNSVQSGSTKVSSKFTNKGFSPLVSIGMVFDFASGSEYSSDY